MTTLPASGQITADGTVATRRRDGTATLTGVGDLAASGMVATRRRDGAAALVGTAELAASSTVVTRRQNSAATLAGVGGLIASGQATPVVAGAATLAGVAGMAASGLVTDIWKGIYQDVGGLSTDTAYVASVYARAPAGQGSSRVRIALSLGGGASGLVSTEATVSETWTRISVVRPTSTGSLRVWAEAAPGQRAEFDAVQLEVGGSPSVFLMHPSDGAIGDAFGYTVTRNLDGSGANAWAQGDVIVNTGQPGNGFIDLYSVRGIKAASQAGPTIVGNVRRSTTYNDWSERWAAGNLRGLYDYGVDTYGFAAGDPAGAWIATDPTNGVRVMFGNTQKARYSNTVLIGEVAAGQMNTLISAGEFRIRVNTQAMFYASPTYLSITQPGDATTYMSLSGQQLSFFRSSTQIARFGSDMVLWDPTNTTSYLQLASSEIRLQVNGLRRFAVLPTQTRFGENVTAWSTIRLTINHVSAQIGEASETSPAGTVMFGRNASGQANMRYNPSNGRLEFRGGTTTKLYVATDGSLSGGSGAYFLDDVGMTFDTSDVAGIQWKYIGTQMARITNFLSTTSDLYLSATGHGANDNTSIALSADVSSGLGQDAIRFFVRNVVRATMLTTSTIFSHALTTQSTLTAHGDLTVQSRPSSWLGGTTPWTTVWRVGNNNPFSADTNMLELVPHSWGDGFSLLFNAYSVGQTNAITAVGNTKRSHAHGGGGTPAAPAILNYDGNGMRWLFAIDQSNSGARGSNTEWTNLFALGINGSSFGTSTITAKQRVRILPHDNTSESYPLAVVQTNNSTSLMYIRGDGQAWVNQAWTIGSDASLKRDIRPFDDDPLALVHAINVRRYRRADRHDGPEEIGVIAQELERAGGLLADLVSVGGASADETVRGVDYTSLAMLTLAAVQRLATRVADLERSMA